MRLLSAIIFSSLLFSVALAQQEKKAAPTSSAKTDTASTEATPGTKNIITKANSLGLTVPLAVIASGIDESKNPIGPGTEFRTDVKRVYCITQIKGVKQSANIEHRWYKNETLISTIELPIKSIIWRTQSYKTITPGMAGEWKVEVVLLPGEELLTTLKFTIK
ncbi:MAG: DUF2914 domain-containing protein [Chitinispirillaceae bacterium]|nr:DUF2914 domain-containing protein [Chitinispirillaceae bacterium]